MVCLGARFGLEYVMSERTCSCIQMNGDGGWYLLLPEPAGPPDPPSNWAAKRGLNMAFPLPGLYPQVFHRRNTSSVPRRLGEER